MRLVTATISLLFVMHVHAASTVVESVRIWSAPDSTRIVLDVSQPVEHNIIQLTGPFRTVIDIKDSSPIEKLMQPGKDDKFIKLIRSGKRNEQDTRLVLDLKKFANAKSFLLKPNQQYGHRLVIDLSTEAGDEKQSKIVPVKIQNDIQQERDVIIAIDAGHGGDDPGARGPRGTYEKDVVLALSKKLAQLINKEKGMKAVLIREGDYFIRLRKRIAKARDHKADLFISIHADAFRDSRVSGSSVYILSKKGSSSEAARWLAEQENASDLIGGVSLDDKDDMLASVLLDLSQTASLEASIDVADRVLSGLKGLGKVHKRKVQSAGFAVLKSPDIPSILIETAYISNPKEENRLLDESYQYKLAQSILNGLTGYFNVRAPEGSILAGMEPTKHIISRGDTLSEIAEAYSVSMQSLKQYNGLKDNQIRVGMVLDIPGDS